MNVQVAIEERNVFLATLFVQILNKADNNYPYKGLVYGSLFERGMDASLAVTDMNDKTALALSAQAEMKGQGINLSLTSAKVILGYKNFNVNEENYLYIGRNSRLSAYTPKTPTLRHCRTLPYR